MTVDYSLTPEQRGDLQAMELGLHGPLRGLRHDAARRECRECGKWRALRAGPCECGHEASNLIAACDQCHEWFDPADGGKDDDDELLCRTCHAG
jgi:hypothetical protein